MTGFCFFFNPNSEVETEVNAKIFRRQCVRGSKTNVTIQDQIQILNSKLEIQNTSMFYTTCMFSFVELRI